jgi:hypothetical protein
LKGIFKSLILLITVVAVIGIVYLIFLYPSHEYAPNKVSDSSVDLKSILTKKLPKNFSLENRRIQTEVEITEEDIESLIMASANKEGNIEAIDVVIENDNLDIFISEKGLKYIPMEVSLFFKSEVKEDKVKLILEDSKLGKLELSKKKVLDKVKNSNINFFDVRPLAGEIILEDSELKSIVTVTDIKLQDSKVSIAIELDFKSIEDFMKVMDMISKN